MGVQIPTTFKEASFSDIERARRKARTVAKSIAHLDDVAYFESFDAFYAEVLANALAERVIDALRYSKTINEARKALGVLA